MARNVLRMGTAALGIATACVAVAAQPLPKAGKLDLVHCTGGDIFVIATVDGAVGGSFKHNGTNRAATPGAPFDLTTTRCNGSFLVVKGKLEFENGVCEEIDRDGDKWLLRFSRTDFRGTYQVVGGAGKYAGMTGEGWYEPVGEFPAPEPGKAMACFRIVGNYQLP